MPNKLLSIIIPAYNMQAYLPHCLNSLLALPDTSSLDIIIVNDGSTDNTPSIAQQYLSQHPHDITLINKTNAHYGSCINTALPIAQGEYVKILDADDWLDTTSLQSLLQTLPTLHHDIIITPYINHYDDTNTQTLAHPHLPTNQLTPANLLHLPKSSLPIFHASLTYRRQLLLALNYHQSEHVLYSDLQWTTIPMATFRSARYLPLPLYHYRRNRQGQSMDPAIRAAHFPDEITVQSHILTSLAQLTPATPHNQQLLHKILLKLTSRLYRDIIVKQKTPLSLLIPFDQQLHTLFPQLYHQLNHQPISDLLPIPYIYLFRHNHTRLLSLAISLRNLLHHS